MRCSRSRIPNVNFRIHQSMELHNICDGRCMKEKCKNVLRKSAPRGIAYWAPKGWEICVQEWRAKGFRQKLWTLFCHPSNAQGTYTIDTALPTIVPLEKSNSGTWTLWSQRWQRRSFADEALYSGTKSFARWNHSVTFKGNSCAEMWIWLYETTRHEKRYHVSYQDSQLFEKLQILLRWVKCIYKEWEYINKEVDCFSKKKCTS